MRIKFAMTSMAIASAVALTAAASPALGSAGQNDWRAHRGSSGVTAAAACTIKPGAVNMYTTAKDVTFDVPGTTDQWLINDNLFAAADPVFTFDDGSTAGATWTFDPRGYANSEAGLKKVDVYSSTDLTNGDIDPDVCTATFQFRRGSKISAKLKVSGSYRTVSGTVQTASWGAKPKYVVVNDGVVDVQKKLNGVWVTKKTVTTNSKGAYSAKIKAAKGTWRAVFEGKSKLGNRTSAEYTG